MSPHIKNSAQTNINFVVPSLAQIHNLWKRTYLGAASLTGALLAASFLWHGLAGVVWHGRRGVAAFEVHDEQLQLASSGESVFKNRTDLNL